MSIDVCEVAEAFDQLCWSIDVWQLYEGEIGYMVGI